MNTRSERNGMRFTVHKVNLSLDWILLTRQRILFNLVGVAIARTGSQPLEKLNLAWPNIRVELFNQRRLA